MDIEFTYRDYDIKATCEFDIRMEGTYLGEIDFEVTNSQGEDVTCDVSGPTTLAIHQQIIERAQQERDLERGSSCGI